MGDLGYCWILNLDFNYTTLFLVFHAAPVGVETKHFAKLNTDLLKCYRSLKTFHGISR